VYAPGNLYTAAKSSFESVTLCISKELCAVCEQIITQRPGKNGTALVRLSRKVRVKKKDIES
jgi:hypothetical protein